MNTTITTFLNRNNKPIFRRCANCVFWKPLSTYDNRQDNPEAEYGMDPVKIKEIEENNYKNIAGCCKNIPLLFAPRMEETRYALTKPNDLCENHRLENEAILEKSNAPVVRQCDVIKPIQ